MRTPTSIESTLAYWREAVAAAQRGDLGRRDALQLSRQITFEPQCGWYRRRYIRGGPYVPVRIWLHQKIDPVTGQLTEDERLRMQVNGNEKLADEFEREWIACCNHPITEAEFSFMCARADWAEEHSPQDPHARPDKRIDWNSVTLPPVPKRKRK